MSAHEATVYRNKVISDGNKHNQHECCGPTETVLPQSPEIETEPNEHGRCVAENDAGDIHGPQGKLARRGTSLVSQRILLSTHNPTWIGCIIDTLPYFPVPSNTAPTVRRMMFQSSVAEAWRA